MQAYYEVETYIPSNHQLHLTLPDEIPEGDVKIAIIYELPISTENKVKKMANFLNSLSDNPENGRPLEQIDEHIQPERNSLEKYKSSNSQTKDLIARIKKFRVNKSLSAKDIKSLCEE